MNDKLSTIMRITYSIYNQIQEGKADNVLFLESGVVRLCYRSIEILLKGNPIHTFNLSFSDRRMILVRTINGKSIEYLITSDYVDFKGTIIEMQDVPDFSTKSDEVFNFNISTSLSNQEIDIIKFFKSNPLNENYSNLVLDPEYIDEVLRTLEEYEKLYL